MRLAFQTFWGCIRNADTIWNDLISKRTPVSIIRRDHYNNGSDGNVGFLFSVNTCGFYAEPNSNKPIDANQDNKPGRSHFGCAEGPEKDLARGL